VLRDRLSLRKTQAPTLRYVGGWRSFWISLAALLLVAFLTAAMYLAWLRVRFELLVADVRAALAAGDPDTALETIGGAQQLYSKNAELRYLAAVSLRRVGRLNEAEQLLREATRLGWDPAQIELQRCLNIAQSGRVDEVEPRLREMMRYGVSDDEGNQIYESLATGYMASYRLKEAWDCLEFWTAWRPATPKARIWRAEICLRVGDDGQAISELEKVIETDPAHFESLLMLAGLRLELRLNVPAAYEAYQQCYDVAPNNPAVLAGLAQCNQMLGNLEQAQALARKVLASTATKQQRADALVVLGQLKLSSGQPTEAVTDFRNAMELVSHLTQAHHGMAQAYSALGDKELAALHANTAVRVSGQNRRILEIAKNLAENANAMDLRCEMARILLQQGRLEEADRWAQTTLQLDPQNEEAKVLMEEVSRLALKDSKSVVATDGLPGTATTGQPPGVTPAPNIDAELEDTSK
jgi:tetratricopeptide (TPR) repeat protein